MGSACICCSWSSDYFRATQRWKENSWKNTVDDPPSLVQEGFKQGLEMAFLRLCMRWLTVLWSNRLREGAFLKQYSIRSLHQHQTGRSFSWAWQTGPNKLIYYYLKQVTSVAQVIFAMPHRSYRPCKAAQVLCHPFHCAFLHHPAWNVQIRPVSPKDNSAFRVVIGGPRTQTRLDTGWSDFPPKFSICLWSSDR